VDADAIAARGEFSANLRLQARHDPDAMGEVEKQPHEDRQGHAGRVAAEARGPGVVQGGPDGDLDDQSAGGDDEHRAGGDAKADRAVHAVGADPQHLGLLGGRVADGEFGIAAKTPVVKHGPRTRRSH